MSQLALADTIPEWCKLARLEMTIPIGSVKNERDFSSMNYIKDPTRNRLETPHLNVCLRIADSPRTHSDLPYHRAFAHWNDGQKKRRGATLPAPQR